MEVIIHKIQQKLSQVKIIQVLCEKSFLKAYFFKPDFFSLLFWGYETWVRGQTDMVPS